MTEGTQSDSEPQASFLSELWKGFEEELNKATEPEPEPEPPSIGAMAGDLGDIIQSFVAISVGVRRQAIEGGLSEDNADAMAITTYGTVLAIYAQATGGGARG